MPEDLECLDIDSEGDEDLTTTDESFPASYHSAGKVAAGLESRVILTLDSTWSSSSAGTIAAGLSDYSIRIYVAEELTCTKVLKGHSKAVTDVRFSHTEAHCLFTSSEDGTIRMWDTRLKDSCVSIYKDDSEGAEQQKWKPFSTMDVNCNGTFLCGGTEQIGEDSFLLFFDIRSKKILGGYWESHLEDVTKVRFHPSDPNQLASGSVDGLINIFDISQATEDEALLYTLGCVTSPDKITWCKRGNSTYDHLSVISQSAEYQVWDIEESAPSLKLDREQITRSLMRTAPEACYLVESFQFDDSDDIFMLGGSKRKYGGCLRLLQLRKKKMSGFSSFIDPDSSKNQIVRAASAHAQEKIFITGGEDGMINVWKPGTQPEPTVETKSKADSKIGKSLRLKPY